MIKERLSCKKILLILNDVDKLGQIENFLGECDWLANGSRVIITTRDKHVLTTLENDPLISRLCNWIDMKLFNSLVSMPSTKTNLGQIIYNLQINSYFMPMAFH